MNKCIYLYICFVIFIDVINIHEIIVDISIIIYVKLINSILYYIII